MLDIPQGVKDLFKTDGILKNIRVVFPNGESRNVCNDKILKESLRFEESLSSREEIKFGLCESSTISFDCVGLDNVKGAKIAVYIEIDVTSIIDTDAEVAAVAQYSSDVPFEFYRLPLGYFIIDECKRDAKMLKRKVKGYSSFSDLTPFDWWVDELWTWQSGYSPSDASVNLDIANFIAATNKGFFDDSDRESITFTKDGTAATDIPLIIKHNGSQYNMSITYGGIWTADIYRMDHNGPWPTTQRLGRVDKSVISDDYESSLADLVDGLSGQNLPEAVINKVVDIVESYLPFNVLGAYKNPNYYAGASYYPSGDHYEPFIMRKGKRIKEGELFVMPWKLTFYHMITINYLSQHYIVYLTDVAFDPTVAVQISEVHLLDDYRFTMPVKSTNCNGGYNLNFVENMLKLDIRKLFESNIELLGCFGKIDRYGYFKTIAFGEVQIIGQYPADDLYPADNLYPLDPYPVVNSGDVAVENIDDDDMISNWYEEYIVKFGSITCTYLSSEVLDENNEPQEVLYSDTWDESKDALVYDISDNEIIKSNIYTEAEIKTLLAPLINVLKIFSFCPSDYQSVGLPYVESGDWAYTSLHGNHVTNLCLSRTLSGIQALRDKVKSD